jgi:cytochrome c-type biogenesis protein CcmI
MVAASLVVAIIGLIAIPLYRAKNQAKRDAITNVSIVKARLVEMQKEVSEGVLGQNELRAAENELKLALVQEHEDDSKQISHTFSPLIIGGIVACFIASLVYVKVNHLDEVFEVAHAPENIARLSASLLDPDKSAAISPQDIQSLALAIRLRLKTQKNDPQGWMFLGRLRMSIGQIDEAIAAFDESLSLQPENTTTRVSLVQALMMANSDNRLQRAQRELLRLMQTDANNDNYNLMMAVVSAELGQTQTALPYYQKVRNKLVENNQMKMALDEKLGFTKPSNGQDESGTLSLYISIAPELKKVLPTVGFMVIFVRPEQQTSGIPLAVKRIALPDLPVQVKLSDADAMIPEMKLSKHSSVNVTVRISETETVEAQKGDLQGEIKSADVRSDKRYDIIVDKELE